MTHRLKDSREPCHKKRRLNCSCCNPLSEAFKSMTGPPRIDAWKMILLRLQSCCVQVHCENDWILPLHRTLLVHVGFTLALSMGDGDSANHELLLVLCKCWQRILGQMKYPQDTFYMDKCEQNEAVGLLSHILERHHDNTFITMACLDVSNHIVAWVSGTDEGPLERRFLSSILRIVANQTFPTISKTALSILKGAASGVNKSHNARILYSAARVMQSAEQGDRSRQESLMRKFKEDLIYDFYMVGLLFMKNETETLRNILSIHLEKDMLLLLSSLSMSSKVASHLSHSEPALELLCKIASRSIDLSKDAVSCLSAIAHNGGHSKILVSKLVAVLCRGNSVVKQNAIPGLCAVLKQNPSILSEPQTRSIISVVSILIRNESEKGKNDHKQWCVKSTQLLSLIARQLAKHGEWSSELENSLQSLTFLLGSNNEYIVHGSLECFLELSLNNGLIRQMARLDNFLPSIARVGINDFLPTKIKHNSIQILWNHAQEKANLPILARTPKVLEALVAVASTATEESAFSDARQWALLTLIKMSELVTNRRILARQVGLLACFIRCARSMTQGDDTLLLSKDKLKERILEIAVLL